MPEPFSWNGQSYGKKVLADLAYLDDMKSFKMWVGFTLARNPFVFSPEQLGDVDAQSLGKYMVLRFISAKVFLQLRFRAQCMLFVFDAEPVSASFSTGRAHDTLSCFNSVQASCIVSF